MAKESSLKKDVEHKAMEKQEVGMKISIGETQKGKQASVYTVKELAEQADILFGTRPECIMTALRTEKKTEFTVDEARNLVKKFLKREVK